MSDLKCKQRAVVRRLLQLINKYSDNETVVNQFMKEPKNGKRNKRNKKIQSNNNRNVRK